MAPTLSWHCPLPSSGFTRTYLKQSLQPDCRAVGASHRIFWCHFPCFLTAGLLSIRVTLSKGAGRHPERLSIWSAGARSISGAGGDTAIRLDKRSSNTGEAIVPLRSAAKTIRGTATKVPLVADHGPLSVLYEDDWLLVVDKPAGLKHEPLHRFVGGSLVNRVVGYLGVEPYTVHRLDMYTSGAVCFAKRLEVVKPLGEQFLQRKVRKTYVVMVVGVPDEPAFTVDAPIARDESHKFARTVVPGGQPAVTHFRVLAASLASRVSKLEATLQTGRTHQIRVHLQHAGYPVFGDEIYGCLPLLWDGIYGRRRGAASGGIVRANEPTRAGSHCMQLAPSGPWAALPHGACQMTGTEERGPLQRQALHAALVAFQHPVTGESISIVSRIPVDMQAAMAACGVE